MLNAVVAVLSIQNPSTYVYIYTVLSVSVMNEALKTLLKSLLSTNFSLVHGKLPSVWKSANVVPIDHIRILSIGLELACNGG